MGPIFKSEKMKSCTSFYGLIIYCVTALSCGLLCSYPYWFPSLSFSVNHFLPKIWCFAYNPKCLFVVINVIVVFLVGESKFVSSNSSSPETEIYKEYVKRSRSLREMTFLEEKKVLRKLEGNTSKEKEKEMMEVDDHDGAEEPGGLPAEELNKRVEAFIARVNKQRWLESKLH